MENKTFYYSDGKEQFGPFSHEEMKSKSISADTLVWFEGLPDWRRAGEVPEMSEFLVHSDFAPAVQPGSYVETAAVPQPVSQFGQMPSATPKPAKNFAPILFVFSIVGVVLGILMLVFSVGLCVKGILLPAFFHSALFFLFSAHLLIIISILIGLKMGRELKVDWNKFF